jgi:hypothetical protein
MLKIELLSYTLITRKFVFQPCVIPVRERMRNIISKLLFSKVGNHAKNMRLGSVVSWAGES